MSWKLRRNKSFDLWGRVHRFFSGDSPMNMEGYGKRAVISPDKKEAPPLGKKSAEEALRESEERLELAMASANLGMWDWNIQSGTLIINERWARMLGYCVEDIEPHFRTWKKLIHPDDAEKAMDALTLHLEGKTPYYVHEQRMQKSRGSWAWILTCGKVVEWDKDHLPIRMTGAHMDITERKNAEEAVRESEKLFSCIIESITDGVVVLDKNFHYLYWNRAMEELFKISRHEVVGKNLAAWDIFPNLEKQSVEKMMHNALEGKKPVQRKEARYVMRDGSVKYISETFLPLKGARGESRGVLGVLRNITERKNSEKEKHTLESRLRYAHKMEAIGTLAGGVAHDFNNILSIIIGRVEIIDLFHTEKGSPIRSNLGEILTATNRARELVDQILTFSHHTEQERKPTLLSPIVKETARFLRATLPSTIEIRQRIEAKKHAVMADSIQMHQIIMNLCTNAGHAMEEKGGVLNMELKEIFLNSPLLASGFSQLNPGLYVRLTVSDTGYGMDIKTRERIFDPYFTTKEKGKGTGLGLSVVHGIVKSMDGAITVDSKPGKGAVFRVFLPRLQGEKEKKSWERKDPIPGGDERILFVDDEKGVLDAGTEILRRLGYHVVSETDSRRALGLFTDSPDSFDLILTDLTMPHMTGLELAKEILHLRSDIPVILCTGFLDKIGRVKVEASEITELIAKPLEARQLSKIIRSALGSGKK